MNFKILFLSFFFGALSGASILWALLPNQKKDLPQQPFLLPQKTTVETKPHELNTSPSITTKHDTKNTRPPHATTPLPNIMELLRSGQYIEAVDYYSENPAPKIKRALLTYMEEIIASPEGFNALTEAFLSHYYADIDVLILIAKHQENQGFFDDALLTYDYAYANASSDRASIYIQQELQKFIKKIITFHTSDKQWSKALDFYGTLNELAVSDDTHRFNEALLYQELGKIDEARLRFLHLRDNPSYTTRIDAILASLNGNTKDNTTANASWEENLALQRFHQHFLIKTKINNRAELNLLIDTGATITSISRHAFKKLSRKISMQFVETQNFNTAGGVASGDIYQVESLKMGQYIISPIQIVVMDISNNEHIDGLLGMNVLRNFQFQLDQNKAILRLNKN